MLYFWIFSMGLVSRVPVLINTEISAAFLIGPCLYFYFTSLLGRDIITVKTVSLHGFPFIISLAIILVINFTDETIRMQFYNPATVIPDYSQNRIILIINSACDLSMAAYFVITAVKTIITLKSQKITSETKSVIFFLIAFSFSSALLMTAGLIMNPALLQLSIILLSILPLGFIFFSFRNPDYAIKVIKETRQLRAVKIKELKQNTDHIKAELNHLMTYEKLYRQNNLTLKSLSDMLSIPAHELSFILNSEINMNFNSYINSFRIGEAKILLLEQSCRGITKIAFDVGFNSTSAFYRYFQKETGVSPKDFQKTCSERS